MQIVSKIIHASNEAKAAGAASSSGARLKVVRTQTQAALSWQVCAISRRCCMLKPLLQMVGLMFLMLCSVQCVVSFVFPSLPCHLMQEMLSLPPNLSIVLRLVMLKKSHHCVDLTCSFPMWMSEEGVEVLLRARQASLAQKQGEAG
jgi:hypothetical protein